MRRLSKAFMRDLTAGFLAPLAQLVRRDKDLDLEIRKDYLNIYFKGNSLLKLAQKGPGVYHVTVHEKFLRGCTLPEALTGPEDVGAFLAAAPSIKENIILYGVTSLEVEYEQLIIRANNAERRNASEYFIVDRQYVAGKRGRFDLTGFYWSRNRRRKGQTVPLCLMEVKFALNADIQDVDRQLSRYYEAIKQKAAAIAAETEGMLRQKLELGLFDQDAARLEAMKTLTISRDIDDFLFMLFLVDYNPHSSHLNLEKLKALPFANQVRIFRGGFALWDENLERLTS